MRLIRNSLWNLVGGIVPAVAAFLTVPVVVHRLGEVHYGLLTLLTSIVGYFALLDVNATQGSVKYLAEFHSRDDRPRINQLLSLGTGLYLAIGLLGGGAIVLLAEWLTTHVFNVPDELHATATTALRFGGIAFAFTQLQAYLLSVPQSLQRFDLSARNEMVFGSLASVSTVVVVLLGGGLVEVMATRAVLAAANVLLLVRLTVGLLPGLQPVRPGRDVVRGLLGFSLYSALSRFSSITYASADKLLIGAYVDMKSLALYSVPFLLANRLFALTFRLGGVMLPEASRLDALGNRDELRHKYLTSTRLVLFLNAGIATLLLLLGRPLLHHWAGPSFDADAVLVLTLVTTAALITSMTNIPSMVNDGMGRPRNSGLFAFASAVLGLLGAWLGVVAGGILGVAWAQCIVSGISALAFLSWVHGRVLPVSLATYLRHSALPSLPPVLVAVAGMLLSRHQAPLGVVPMLLAGAGVALLLLVYGWFVVLPADLRKSLSTLLQRRLQQRIG